ncbi:hypothetical protein EDB92DRAFT_1802895, partial [Lactarius akahatsu]
MSQTPSITAASSRFQDIFQAALKSYQKQTKKDLIAHPLASQLQSCQSTSVILSVLQDQVREFDQAHSGDERLTKWLIPTVIVLYAFSAVFSEGVSLVFSPAKVIFAGIGVLLLATKDVAASKDALAELFERIGSFFKRLEAYTEVAPTATMTDIITKIMVEVLTVFGIATKEMRRGSAKKFLKKLAGRTDLEDAIKKLDRLTQEEARMALAEVLKITHIVYDDVKVVDSKVDGMGDKVDDVGEKVVDVGVKVEDIGDRVQCVDEKVQVVIDGARCKDLTECESIKLFILCRLQFLTLLRRFRWVFCQLEALRHCFPPNLRQFLNELPETLDETYERILRSINKAQRDNAHRLLQCLTVAIRPLRVEELAELLAFDFGASRDGGIPKLKDDWRWNDQEEAVLSTCSSLIAVVPSGRSRVVQFSHFSVKEYLTSPRLAQSDGDVSRFHVDLDAAHTILAQACLGTLLQLDEHAGKSAAEWLPLVEYAAQHWLDH